MKTLTFCLILSSVLAFGQRNDVQRMDRHAATQAWATANISLPDNTPSITGGGLITESETNGVGRRVWLVYSQPGTYLMQGKTCNGDEVKLGELQWEPNQYNQTGSGLIYDSNALSGALPFFSQVCTIDMIRIDKGKIEKSSVEVNPWQQPPALGFQFGSEGLMKGDGRYFVATTPLPADAVVILGRMTVAAEIQRSPAGSIVVFPLVGMPPVGPTTITVCSKGKCNTTTFERKVAVEMPSGKG